MLNLSAGSVGIVLALQGDLLSAAVCIWLGSALDFWDGFLARLLRAQSSLGQQLDAFADLVTFGLLPTAIMYALLQQHTHTTYLPWIALLHTLGGALRLARFNTETQQQNTFNGLPIPAHGLFISTLPWLIANHPQAQFIAWLTRPVALAAVTVIMAALLIAPIKLMAFKFKNFAWQPNRFRYAFLLLAATLVLLGRVEGLAISILLYLLLSILLCGKTLTAKDRIQEKSL